MKLLEHKEKLINDFKLKKHDSTLSFDNLNIKIHPETIKETIDILDAESYMLTSEVFKKITEGEKSNG